MDSDTARTLSTLLETPRMRRLLRAWPMLAGWLCHAFALRARLPATGGGA